MIIKKVDEDWLDIVFCDGWMFNEADSIFKYGRADKN